MKKFKRPDHRDPLKFTCLCGRCSQVYYQAEKKDYELNPQGVLHSAEVASREHKCVAAVRCTT